MVDQVDPITSDAVDAGTDTDSTMLQSAFLDTVVQMGAMLMTPLVTDMASETNNE